MNRSRPTVVILLLGLALLAVAAEEEPGWVKQVPDFRSSWPPPLEPGTTAPEFALTDARSGKRISLAKAREGKRATLLLFVDENCGTCKRRGADLAATLMRSRAVEGAAVLAIFARNLVQQGKEPVLAFAKKAEFPEEVPLLLDDTNDTAEVTLAYRVTVAPTAVVLDSEGKVAYFGLALPRKGSDLLPGIVRAVAEGGEIDGPAVRPPFG